MVALMHPGVDFVPGLRWASLLPPRWRRIGFTGQLLLLPAAVSMFGTREVPDGDPPGR